MGDLVKKGNAAKTVLLVDDDAMALDLGTRMLKRLGCQVFTATSGSDAIEIYKQHGNKIDLMIVDYFIPNMTGAEIFLKLMEFDPELKLLISSGYYRHRHVDEMINSGCKGFIAKPFKFSELSQTLADILN
jgi:two-component system cell cycle sensor histidine kinase/response regulator CckA